MEKEKTTIKQRLHQTKDFPRKKFGKNRCQENLILFVLAYQDQLLGKNIPKSAQLFRKSSSADQSSYF